MRVVLLGTGSADGWPNPFCDCRSCRWALGAGEIRGQTSALIDDAILVDCGPETPRAALRFGHTLAGVRHILFTHGHFDHVGPAALLMRHWIHTAHPIEVWGPEGALNQCKDWVGPDDDSVRFHRVQPGAQLLLRGTRSDYRVRALAAAHDDGFGGGAVLYDVLDRGDPPARLLWATDTGPLPAETMNAVAGATFDAVFLEQTFGPKTDHGTEHHDLAAFAKTLERLRERGAITAGSHVVAIHLSHFNPPGPELESALGTLGARAGRDGEVIQVG